MKRGSTVMWIAAICAGALALAGGAAGTGESVRAELVRLEKEKGLAIAYYWNNLGVVSFKKRASYEMRTLNQGGAWPGTVSPDGAQLATEIHQIGPTVADFREFLGIIRTNGTDLREFPGIFPYDACWSPDETKLAMSYVLAREVAVAILELKTRALTKFDPKSHIDHTSHFTSRCWSPDGKELVFDSEGKVRVYNIETGHVRILATGTEPTWSPDGNRIAFRDGDNYYAIHPSLETKKKLFHKTRAVSGLFWSPDGRFVGYVHEDLFALDVEFYHLMVRRLTDNDETWVADGVSCCINYQWIENRELLARALATGKR